MASAYLHVQALIRKALVEEAIPESEEDRVLVLACQKLLERLATGSPSPGVERGATRLAEELDGDRALLAVLAVLSDNVAKETSASREPDEHLTTREAARRLGISSVNTVKRWLMDGRLDGCRAGDRWLVSARSVQKLLDAGQEDLRHLQAEHARVDKLLAADNIDIDPSDPKIREILRHDHRH